jgi:hypothetical protein
MFTNKIMVRVYDFFILLLGFGNFVKVRKTKNCKKGLGKTFIQTNLINPLNETKFEKILKVISNSQI